MHGIVDARREAGVSIKLLLTADYSGLQKFDIFLWFDVVRLELRVRFRLGVFAQWHQLEVYITATDIIPFTFIPIPE